MNKPTRNQRARGALLGLAVGDAIGTTAEFMPRGTFAPLTGMVGGGPFQLEPGQWTDDTSMALCLAASLTQCGFDLQDQIERYTLWFEDGYMSSNGHCFDIGTSTHEALLRFQNNGQPLAGSTDSNSAGNGSIMRLAPVPIFYQDSPVKAIDRCEAQSRTTHQAPECLMACRLLGEMLLKALQGQTKTDVLSPSQHTQDLTASLQAINQGGYRQKTEAQIFGTGYVVQSLEAAVWCFWQTDNFADCVLQAANLGDDADTTAAIAGQLAGAFYGEAGIPAHWLQTLACADEIGKLAEKLTRQQRQ